ncbi:type II secretion system F family protein, partial [Intrasporangium calvum]
APGGADSARGAPRSLRELWSADPVEVMREWRRRRRAPSTVDGALKLLEGVAPALEAGLTPAVALRLSGAALGSGADASTLRMVDEVTRAGERGDPVARVWRSWAEAGRSPDLRFVAAAWQLSEMTGAPLAEAVHRAVSSLREARERTRRVHVAVAGPRATVVVLTLLPLTGPLFGLACGVGPAELYLASPLSAAAASLGLALIWAGRRWCRRLVESVTAVGGTSGSERRSLA